MSRFDPKAARVLLPVLIIFLTALVIRIINLEIIRDNPFFNYPVMDEKYHDEWAQEIAEGNLFERAPFYRAPGYPLFLGSVYAIFGHNYHLARLIGVIIGAFSCVLIFLIGTELFSTRVGVLAGLLACFYSMFLYFDSMLLTVYLEIFFCLLGLLFLVKWVKHKTNGKLILAGVFWGLVSIIRPSFLIFIPVLVIYLFIITKNIPFGKRLKPALLFIVGLIPPILAIMIINITVGKDMTLLAWNGGINFYLGNNPGANGWSATSQEIDATWWGGYKDAILIAQNEMGKDLAFSQISNYWFTKGLQYICSKPLNWAGLMLKKLYILVNSYELSNNQSIKTFVKFSRLLQIPILDYGLIIVIGLLGAALSPKRKETTLVLLFLITYSIGVILFFVPARYRMPLVPFLLIFTAYAIFWFFQKVKKKQLKQIAIFSVVVIAMIVFVHTDLYGTHQDTVKSSEVYATYGNYYFSSGNYEKAIAEYKEALIFDPDNTGAMNALGDAYFMLGQQNDAIRVYRKSIKIKKNVDGLCKLGIINFQLHQMDSAQSCFLDALAMDSTNPEIYYYIGMSYALSNEPEVAIENLEKSLNYYPDPKYLNNIHYNLGKLYLVIGNNEQAKRHLFESGMEQQEIHRLVR